MTEANRALFCWPNLSDVSPVASPTFAGGSWIGTLPLTNLQMRYLWQVARSSSAALADTRFRVDLKRDAQVRGVVIPKHTGSMAARFRFLGVPSSLLFDYEAGDDIVALGGTFSRASVASYVDASGILRSAASGVIRDSYFFGGKRHCLLEDTRANLCLQSENFGTTWAANGSVTRTAAAHTLSGVSLDLLSDASAAAAGNYSQTITFTGTAVKAVAVYVRQGTATSSAIVLRDTTASANRLLGVLTWPAGAPSVAMTTGTYLGAESLIDGVYRLWFVTTSVTATNTNSLQVYPAADAALSITGTGTLYVGGVQAENGPFPSSYIKTTTGTVTRAADSLTFPFTPLPQAMTWYVKLTEMGTLLTTNSAGVVGVGSSTNAALFLYNDTGGYEFLHRRSTDKASAVTAASFGQTVELRGGLNADGSVQLGQSLNGAAETLGTLSAANALAANWSDTTLTINSRGGASMGFCAFQSVRIAVASSNSLATMQSVVYDSGWITPFPTGKTLDDVQGMNVPVVAIVPTTQTPFRYVSVQIDDAFNVAGSIDISRLMVGGAFQPSFNFGVGAKLGVQSSTQRTETEGGSATYLVKPQRRTMAMTFENGPSTDSLDHGLQLARIAGLAGQFYFVMDPSDPTRFWQTSFLAVLQSLPSFGFETQLSTYLTHDYTIIEEL